MLNKCSSRFKGEREHIFLGHCAVSPLYGGAVEKIKAFADNMGKGGVGSLLNYVDVLPSFHTSYGELLQTKAENISFVQNTATAMSMLANGYPFKKGDRIISFVNEYPSNHYPWVSQQKRGVELDLLIEAKDELGRPCWSMDQLEQLVTPNTRVVAISHVQFATGYAAALHELGQFCKEHEIDFIVDCAQSLGCLPVYPEKFNIAGLAASGWKWLMGPFGAGVMYTSKTLREKIEPTMTGPGLMQQGLDYLNHNWDPHSDGKMFEFSSVPWDHAMGLDVIVKELFKHNSMENIRDEVFRLQDIFLEELDFQLAKPLLYENSNRSGIIGIDVGCDPKKFFPTLLEKGVMLTGPAGYLRLAPHFYMEEEQLRQAASIVNEVLFLGR